MEVGTLRTRGVSYLVDDAHPGDVASDMGVIAAELHCTAVMIISADPQRLEATARLALDQGLEVWARLDSTDLRPRAMLHRLADAAQRLEALRSGSRPAITLVVGSEFSHTVPGMVPGPRSFIRLKVVLRCRKILRRHIRRRLDALLRRATAVARESFRGQVTYSAAAWEDVDWALFDVVGVSLYRSAANHDHYRELLRGLRDDHDRPLVVSEFGCGAFSGADAKGAGSFGVVNWFSDPPRVRDDTLRDESVQADYLGELIDLYDAEDIHGCFVFTYAMPGYPHSSDPTHDLDKAGFGLISSDDAGHTRQRKRAFHAVAERYRAIEAHDRSSS